MHRGIRILFLIFALILSACARPRTPVPPGVIPDATSPTVDDEQFGHEVLNQLREKYQVDFNNPNLDRIEKIVDRLAKAAHADKDPWHVYLFKDDNFKNAGATRGNHVFIWTGMLDSTQNDGELAAVIAHEMGHVLARHTEPDPNEELRKMLIQVGAMAAGIAVASSTRNPWISRDIGQVTSSVTQQIGEGIFSNPFSQELEYEADQIGLMLMAEAKFDPNEALAFWERADRDPDMSAAIPFLSTHPPAADRLDRLRNLLPLAMSRYDGSTPQVTNGGLGVTTDKKGLGNPHGASPERLSGDGNGDDSFDLNSRIDPNAIKRDRPQLDTKTAWADSWKVISDRTILFQEPSSDSRQLGELRHGAVVQALGRNRGWLRVRTPEHGFLRESELAPVYSGPARK